MIKNKYYLLIDDIWLKIKSYLIDYSLIKFKKWKLNNKFFIENVINDIKNKVFCFKKDIFLWIYKHNHGFIFKNAINPSWRDNNIRVYSISKDSYYGQYMISNNYYYVLFYDINDIPSKYL